MIDSQSSDLGQSIGFVLLLQAGSVLVLLLVCMLIHLVLNSALSSVWLNHSFSIVYGGVLAVIGTLLSARGVSRSSKRQELDGQLPVNLGPIYLALINKFIIIGGGIALGLVMLQLQPILLVLAFLSAQISAALVLMHK